MKKTKTKFVKNVLVIDVLDMDGDTPVWTREQWERLEADFGKYDPLLMSTGELPHYHLLKLARVVVDTLPVGKKKKTNLAGQKTCFYEPFAVHRQSKFYQALPSFGYVRASSR